MSPLSVESLSRTGANESGELSPAEIEAKFKPFFEERISDRRRRGGGRQGGRPQNLQRPSNKDYFAIARAWDRLSPQFQALYAEAAAIKPGDYQEYHISPRGKFKIFYSTTGANAINPLVDTVGYGVSGDPHSWRTRSSAPNGVPDYLDETAFALDSAWSMIIDRFGFRTPINTPDPEDGSTDYYSVVIMNLGEDGYYGATVPHGSRALSSGGFPSYIELNSDWSGSSWASTGYNERPFDAVHVTCAHEMLHTSQYAMVWTMSLDNLPYGWIEGSAVLMEEIAFPDVNDYLYYTLQYFQSPGLALLGSSNIYMNSIILKYIYERVSLTDSIAFIKAVHDNNFAQRSISFHSNIEAASLEHAGKPWVEVLNGFHAESYFTGNRSDRPRYFVSDAEAMRIWSLPAVSDTSATKAANQRAAAYFMYTPQPNHPDTLTLHVSGTRDASISGRTWAASAIIIETDGSAEIVKIPMNQNGIGTLAIANWRRKTRCVVVASNASPSYRGDVTVTINGSPPNLPDTVNPATQPLRIAPNVVRISRIMPVIISGGGNIVEIRVTTQEGKALDRYIPHGRPSPNFMLNVNDNAAYSISWYPNHRLTPGVCHISVTSRNTVTGRRSVTRRRVMLLP